MILLLKIGNTPVTAPNEIVLAVIALLFMLVYVGRPDKINITHEDED
jgi:hypothetical protein